MVPSPNLRPTGEQPRPAPDRFAVLFLGLGVLVLHLVWLALDEQPQVWDMAHHQVKGWESLRTLNAGRLPEDFPSLSSYYPPLYYLQEMVVLSLWPNRDALVFLSNLPGLVMLFGGVWWLASRCLTRGTAPWAALLAWCFPLVAWTSRFSLLDVALSGWVMLAVCLVAKSRHLERKGHSLLLGLVIAAGLLTKWTFILFLVFPLVWALVRSRDRKRSLLNLVDAALVAAPLVFWWYLPNAGNLVERFTLTMQAAGWEQDPGLESLLGWLYYPRSLASYYLFLPLTALFVLGSFLKSERKRDRPPEVSLIRWTFWGGLFLLTTLEAKDPRYVLPLAGPLAILILLPWDRRRWVVRLAATLALLQFLAVSFPLPLVSGKLALFQVPDDGDYRSAGREWVLFASRYFDVAGPPRRENWRHREILEQIPEGARVGFVPDLAHFHLLALRLQALESGRELDVIRLGHSAESVEHLRRVQAVVGKTGHQGISYLTAFNPGVYERLEQNGWRVSRRWSLPDGTEALLWLPSGPRETAANGRSNAVRDDLCLRSVRFGKNRHGPDFHEGLGAGQRLDIEQGVGGIVSIRVESGEQFPADLQEGTDRFHTHQVGGELHHVPEGGAGAFENPADVLEDLPRLGRGISFSHQLAFG